MAFGFLCGRDYETEKFVARAGDGSDPISERRRLFKVTAPAAGNDPESGGPSEPASGGVVDRLSGWLPGRAAGKTGSAAGGLPVLGLPAALYMAGELPFWEKYFALLGIPVAVDRDTDPIEAAGPSPGPSSARR